MLLFTTQPRGKENFRWVYEVCEAEWEGRRPVRTAAGTPEGEAERLDPAGGSSTGARADGTVRESLPARPRRDPRDSGSRRAGNGAEEETSAPLKGKAGLGGRKGSGRSAGKERSFQHPEEKAQRAHGTPTESFHLPGLRGCEALPGPPAGPAPPRPPALPAQRRLSGCARDAAHAHPACFPPKAVSPPSRGTTANTHRGLRDCGAQSSRPRVSAIFERPRAGPAPPRSGREPAARARSGPGPTAAG